MSNPLIVVGVTSHQSSAVIDQALVFARKFDATLLCVHVDASRFVVETRDDGTVVAAPYDPDAGEAIDEVMDPAIVERAGAQAAAASTLIEFLETAGDPARTLGRIADERDAALIVVGARRASLGGSIREFFARSVAANLTHRQTRPVVVVPVETVGPKDALPWDEAR
ncbi:universal stress protein [Frondihabitans australicus]|uniref:Nucleotide-binding universal stress UspA family protein n=1 Tax=Frondihabitans australicus TaxID=386892 RepID=A0A495IJL5_9MICO|nr:universal stress protein [Frondihabitans australicus]RKR76153.1 nucleotide-binding universal stress UspA family protein [Frondihabitans australicus]